jgi:hypothetical protein
LAAVPAINRLILRRLSAKLVLVGAEDLDKLRAAFAERGIPLEGGMVRSPEGDTSSAEPEKTPEGGRRNFVHVSKVTPSDVRRIWGIDYTDFVPTGNDEIARVARAAIVRRQTLLLLLSDDKGAPLMAEITPLQVERFRGDTYLEGQCAGCHQKHSIVLDQILAVAPRQRVS